MSGSDLSIVAASGADVPDILAIYNHYIQHSTATFHQTPLNLEEMKGLLFFENPRYGSFTIRKEEKICGYCIISRHHPRTAYDGTATLSIYLHPEAVGQGIGRKALEFLDHWASRCQLHVLLAIICAENAASIKLFEQSGYSRCGYLKEAGRKFDRWLDVVYYQKILIAHNPEHS